MTSIERTLEAPRARSIDVGAAEDGEEWFGLVFAHSNADLELDRFLRRRNLAFPRGRAPVAWKIYDRPRKKGSRKIEARPARSVDEGERSLLVKSRGELLMILAWQRPRDRSQYPPLQSFCSSSSRTDHSTTINSGLFP